jgi:hypothetical protein
MRTKQKIRKEIEKALLKFEEEKRITREEQIKFISEYGIIDFKAKNDLIRKYLHLLDI